MVIDDIHKIEIIFGCICFILFILLMVGCNIYFKVEEYKMKKDSEKKKKEEEENNGK